jgi:hypothetical protein
MPRFRPVAWVEASDDAASLPVPGAVASRLPASLEPTDASEGGGKPVVLDVDPEPPFVDDEPGPALVPALVELPGVPLEDVLDVDDKPLLAPDTLPGPLDALVLVPWVVPVPPTVPPLDADATPCAEDPPEAEAPDEPDELCAVD